MQNIKYTTYKQVNTRILFTSSAIIKDLLERMTNQLSSNGDAKHPKCGLQILLKETKAS